MIVPVVLTCLILFATGCRNTPTSAGRTGNRTPLDEIQNNAVINETALHEAALNGQYEVVKDLLSADADVNVLDPDGRTALMYATFNGHLEIAEILIDSGTEINLQDQYGRTALMFASSGPYPETVKLLLDHGADPNLADAEEHFTALMYAAAEGQLEVVKLLLENHADPAMLDVDGDDAETFARNNGHLEVAEMFSATSR